MQREVFILPNGESFFAWDIHFSEATRHNETRPCDYHQEDGTVRKGVLHITVESAEVSFSVSAGSARVGMEGQLSGSNDIFFEVTISALEPGDNEVRAHGKARRTIDVQMDG